MMAGNVVWDVILFKIIVKERTVNKRPLSSFSMFKGLNPEQLQKVREIIREKDYSVGDIVLREGESGDNMYLLLSGDVEISKSLTLVVGRGDVGQRDKSLTRLCADDCAYFGEMALLRENSVRTATVKVLSDSVLGIIHRKDFQALCESDIELGYRIMTNMAQTLCIRLEKANQDVMKLTTAFSLALQG